jgi:hypothetical protein
MVDLQTLYSTINELSADELKQLYTYIVENRLQFLESKTQDTSSPIAPRILGLHAHLGEAWMSDDFDAELPDSFWLGEE